MHNNNHYNNINKYYYTQYSKMPLKLAWYKEFVQFKQWCVCIHIQVAMQKLIMRTWFDYRSQVCGWGQSRSTPFHCFELNDVDQICHRQKYLRNYGNWKGKSTWIRIFECFSVTTLKYADAKALTFKIFLQSF